MGNPFIEISKTFKKFDAKKPAIDTLNIDEFKEVFIFHIQDRLFKKGIDAFGNILKTNRSEGLNVYARRTIKKKQKFSQPWKNVTLKDNGTFYKSWTIKMSKFIIEIEANFNKGKDNIYDNFTRRYDTPQKFYSAILSMTDKELTTFSINIILPQYVEFIKRDLEAKIAGL